MPQAFISLNYCIVKRSKRWTGLESAAFWIKSTESTAHGAFPYWFVCFLAFGWTHLTVGMQWMPGPVHSVSVYVCLMCTPAEPWASGWEAHHPFTANSRTQEGAGLRLQQWRERGWREKQHRPCWHQARRRAPLHYDEKEVSICAFV